jgi:hypothetical protein
MKLALDFLSLRPVFTRCGILAIWYAYLIATLIQVVQYVGFSFAAVGNVSVLYHFSLVGPILFSLIHVALVRLFLEMALQFIEKRSLSL